uniref:UDENN domain-containing protein n=1 Tax=Anisakis simplex TaxID=6269 RepID=A0A0M3JS27_ANISI
LFDVFCEVGAGMESGKGSKSVCAIILQKYPDDFNDEQTLKSVTQFSFPCGLDDDDVEAVQLFSFVLTDQKSQYTYAFCRHTPRNNTCLCILRGRIGNPEASLVFEAQPNHRIRYVVVQFNVKYHHHFGMRSQKFLFSGLPWASTFYTILNHITTVMNTKDTSDLESILTCAYHTPIPRPGGQLRIESTLGQNKLELTVPDCSRLPTLREDKYMLEFYNAIPEKQMISLYASLLKERRIIFTGRKLSQLSSCIFAAATLLYPMYWQNLFIPVLPADLIDMLMAPMPYLVGVPKKTFLKTKQSDIGEIVVVDIDSQVLQTSHNDLSDLPSEVIAFLRHQLRSSSQIFVSDAFARSFLRTNVFLFGGYRLGLTFGSSSKVTWNREKFVQSQRASLQPFLRSLLGQDGVQYLERFIEERLEALNKGVPIDDEFERESRLFDSNTKQHPLKASNLVAITNPEVLQQAVSTVCSLNFISVMPVACLMYVYHDFKERLGRLTPKEMRRSPMSISTSNKYVAHWDDEDDDDNDNDKNNASGLSFVDAQSWLINNYNKTGGEDYSSAQATQPTSSFTVDHLNERRDDGCEQHLPSKDARQESSSSDLIDLRSSSESDDRSELSLFLKACPSEPSGSKDAPPEFIDQPSSSTVSNNTHLNSNAKPLHSTVIHDITSSSSLQSTANGQCFSDKGCNDGTTFHNDPFNFDLFTSFNTSRPNSYDQPSDNTNTSTAIFARQQWERFD